MGGDIGNVELGEDVLGRLSIVVGRAADQREAGEGNERIHGGSPVLQEVTFDRGTRVEAAGEGRHHREPAGFQRGDHPVVMLRVAGKQVRAHHQLADRAGCTGAR